MHTDWDAQRERLSAYLDGALSAAERAEVAAHLSSCEECQRELAAHRQTKALLGALPAPALPRSFALPTTLRPLPAPRSAPPRWTRPLQTLGAIAAMVGVGFLVAATLPHPIMTGSAATYAPAMSNGGADTSGHVTMSPAATSSPREGAASAGGGSPTTAPTTVTTVPPATSTPSSIHEPQHAAQFGNAAQQFPTLPVTGGVLLVGGAAALAIGALARRRADGPDGPVASDVAE